MNEILGLHWNGLRSSLIGEVLGGDTDELWWLTCVQCGAFCHPDGDAVEAHLERFWFQVPALENTDVMTLRPGAVSAGAHLMSWDEWAYLVGFRASDEGEAAALASEFADLSMPRAVWPHLGSSIELLVHDFAGGDAAVFTSRRDWFERLRGALPQAQEITPREWEQVFDDAEKETQRYLGKLGEKLGALRVDIERKGRL